MMEVTDEMVIKAVHAYQDEEIRVFGEVRTPNNGARHGAMRAALEAALSHAAGQDGEQCRAASVDEDTSWLAQQIEGARDYATGGCVRPDDDDPDEQKWWDDLTRAAQILRALSRGVPEDTTRLDWLTAPDAIDRHVSQCLNGEWCAQDDVVSAHYGATPREAIDAAIAAQRKEGE